LIDFVAYLLMKKTRFFMGLSLCRKTRLRVLITETRRLHGWPVFVSALVLLLIGEKKQRKMKLVSA